MPLNAHYVISRPNTTGYWWLTSKPITRIRPLMKSLSTTIVPNALSKGTPLWISADICVSITVLLSVSSAAKSGVLPPVPHDILTLCTWISESIHAPPVTIDSLANETWTTMWRSMQFSLLLLRAKKWPYNKGNFLCLKMKRKTFSFVQYFCSITLVDIFLKMFLLSFG